jgi:adenylate kinase family enzyme
MKIHITGASGSGTTTLGSKLSETFQITHFDTDDFFWQESIPPYQFSRKKKERQALLQNALDNNRKWIISGSLCGWGDFAIHLFDLVIFLWVPTDIRIERLRLREMSKFGKQALEPGGKMHETHQEFIRWASEYDTGNVDMRSKSMHELWLKKVECNILRYEGNISTDAIIKDVSNHFTTA